MTARSLRQLLLVILFALVGIGLVAVYSSSAMVCEMTYGDSFYFLKTQLFGVALGLALAVGCLFVPFEKIRSSSRWLLIASFVLLVLVLAVGQQVGGAQRWFRIGHFSVQPSELAKLSLILYMADALERKADHIRSFWKGVLPLLAIAGLAALLTLMQPDLGTALVMVSVTFILLAVANADRKQLLGLGILGVAALVVLIGSAEYRRRRMLAFLDPWQDPHGIGYQIIQSYCALARGGVWGVGLGSSWQKLFYLPSAHTDFIFAILGEELGWIGTSAVIGLFGLLVTCGFRLAMLAQNAFSKYVLCGIVGMLGLEAVINIGVVTGMLPTKGLPLPFISYGGTSMVINLLAAALIFQASRYGERHGARPVSE